jgi:hypothetical protein
LRQCPFTIVTLKGKKPTRAETVRMKDFLPLWTGGYVSCKATLGSIKEVTQTYRLTDKGRLVAYGLPT